VRTAAGEPRLVGVVSWGDRCGDDSPGVYADVAELADWITGEGGVDPEAAVIHGGFMAVLHRLFG
jgi:secreted trypsin-like serine protease